MEGLARRKHRWTPKREAKEPTLYDEWLSGEKKDKTARRQSVQAGDTSTIRPVPHSPEQLVEADAADSETTIMPESSTTKTFERRFLPHTTTTTTTTTVVGGPSTADPSKSTRKSKKPRKLVKERDVERDVHKPAPASPPSSRNGSTVAGMLGRNGSKSSTGRLMYMDGIGEYNVPRPRTKTLDERRRASSPTNIATKRRSRLGSTGTAMPSSPSSGAEYLASVPASTTPPPAPSVKSVGSPVQHPAEEFGRRSISPESSSAAESSTSSNPTSGARRILHLMRTLNGRMSGNVLLRRDPESAWTQIYCYIQEDTGRLMYEPRGGEGAHRTLVPALRGCAVKPGVEDETPFLIVNLPQLDMIIHLKLLTQADFDSWFAALLYWQSLGPPSPVDSDEPRPPSSSTSGISGRPELPPRTSSARKRRDRASSTKSDRRKSVVSPHKEAPVIKIGKMIYWDTNIGYSNGPNTSSQPSSGRPQTHRMQSLASRRWRRISGQLRENGELKLISDSDNSLISVVQLSQLSRCAIQRLDSSVLENEHCIAVYPQYTSNPANNQPGFIRPIFLSFENRVFYEVWFVLLRAFTIPQLYGPRMPSETIAAETEDMESSQDLENMLATTITDMFRMERTLTIKIIEAKMHPPSIANSADTGFAGGKAVQAANVKVEQHGYYAEVLLDNETRGKTVVKSDNGLHPLWTEHFKFLDLPPVLNSASVVIKRRPPDHAFAREQQESSRIAHEAYGLTSNENGGFTGLNFDVACGKVEIYLQELEAEREVKKWWPIVNSYGQRVGEVFIEARAEEGVILMTRDYQPLNELLHRFSSGLTLHIAQMIPNELRRVSECLLNIYQVSGKASDWLMALIEEEIDGIHKETPNRRHESGTEARPGEYELKVRADNKNATAEVSLLFRANSLLTKALELHMGRVGREYLEESLGPKIREICEKDPDCEVDPSRVSSTQEIERNWRRLITFTQEVWKSIFAMKARCPVELRIIFRHIRACAEDRYGDFLRSVKYSSVSGFLFLRFFCPAILNPKLNGLIKDEPTPRTRRTLMLVAKSIQTLGNMASFGAKEIWMEQMNSFLVQNRTSFKDLIDDVCYVPRPLPILTPTDVSTPIYPDSVVSGERHLSYTTPMTIMARLPPTSREGFPSLPYLIDQARAYAELVQTWLEATASTNLATETSAAKVKSHAEFLSALRYSEGDLNAFHEACLTLHKRTQECLSRAERAERPNSAESFKWDQLIDQLRPDQDEPLQVDPMESSYDTLAENIASNPVVIPLLPPEPQSPPSRTWNVVDDEDAEDTEAEDKMTRLYDTTPSGSQSAFAPSGSTERPNSRPTSSGAVHSIRDALRRTHISSRGSDTVAASASASASNVSSDTDHTTSTTALPSYDREVRHRERREAAKHKIKQSVEAARMRDVEKEKEKEKRRVKTPIVSALRRKKERESKSSASQGTEGYASHG